MSSPMQKTAGSRRMASRSASLRAAAYVSVRGASPATSAVAARSGVDVTERLLARRRWARFGGLHRCFDQPRLGGHDPLGFGFAEEAFRDQPVTEGGQRVARLPRGGLVGPAVVLGIADMVPGEPVAVG